MRSLQSAGGDVLDGCTEQQANDLMPPLATCVRHLPCCSTDVQRAEEALATLLPLVPGVKYFRWAVGGVLWLHGRLLP